MEVVMKYRCLNVNNQKTGEELAAILIDYNENELDINYIFAIDDAVRQCYARSIQEDFVDAKGRTWSYLLVAYTVEQEDLNELYTNLKRVMKQLDIKLVLDEEGY